MSLKKSFLLYTAFFTVSAVFIVTSIILLIPSLEKEEDKTPYKESEAVSAFFTNFDNNKKMAQMDIEVSRDIASKWIRKEQSNMQRHMYFQRRAYDLIANEIANVSTFDQLNYHLSRLPTTEKQAYTTLTVNRSNVITLDNHNSYIAEFLYPIQLPENDIDGKDVLITSIFSGKRVSPFGSGGISPHYAVDLINIGNVDYISAEGKLIRNGNHPGYIVSAADGVVTKVGYNHVFGWNVTVEHDKTLLPASKRRNVEYIETFYAHLKDDIFVENDEEVIQGEKLGYVGNTGLSTGPHLHYEIRLVKNDGSKEKVNPFPGS